MNILMLWDDLPSPVGGTALPAFNLLRYLGQRHNITLISFKDVTEESLYRYDLNQYCEVIDPIDIVIPKSLPKIIAYTIKNTLHPQNLFSRNFSLFNLHYLPKMQNKIKDLLTSRKFDLIYTSPFMPHFVQDVSLPKVVHLYDCLTETQRRKYLNAENLAMKFFWWLQYLRIKWCYEGNIFKKFDACIVVSEGERKNVLSLFKNINVFVVPNGVDSEFFKPSMEQEEWPNLVFVGQMNILANIDAMLYFCGYIWDQVKKSIPNAKLYIVGRNPTKEIKDLAEDQSIIVTGYVEDVRHFISRASIVIAPFTFAAGMKNKVLEAMAMAKPVVSTTAGVEGIDVLANDNVIIADEPEAFAERVVELLSDAVLRQTIGMNGRKLVLRDYSWQHSAQQVEEIFCKVVNK
jgi:sugar transferase (PEP-CTERM/EpsH1 system associated)